MSGVREVGREGWTGRCCNGLVFVCFFLARSLVEGGSRAVGHREGGCSSASPPAAGAASGGAPVVPTLPCVCTRLRPRDVVQQGRGGERRRGRDHGLTRPRRVTFPAHFLSETTRPGWIAKTRPSIALPRLPRSLTLNSDGSNLLDLLDGGGGDGGGGRDLGGSTGLLGYGLASGDEGRGRVLLGLDDWRIIAS